MTVGVLSLAEFLLAWIAEDEAVARSAGVVEEADSWWVDGPAEHSGKYWVYATGEKFGDRALAEHIACHDPARVLAECEAKRRIVELHAVADSAFEGDGNERPGRDCRTCIDDYPCATLRVLAAVYADHEDYRAEWKP